MPMAQTDSNGGVIVTDWYVNPQLPTERMKVTVSILDQDLRADAVRVAALREVNQGGQWVSAPVAASTSSPLWARAVRRISSTACMSSGARSGSGRSRSAAAITSTP